MSSIPLTSDEVKKIMRDLCKDHPHQQLSIKWRLRETDDEEPSEWITSAALTVDESSVVVRQISEAHAYCFGFYDLPDEEVEYGDIKLQQNLRQLLTIADFPEDLQQLFTSSPRQSQQPEQQQPRSPQPEGSLSQTTTTYYTSPHAKDEGSIIEVALEGSVSG
jgi:hypothetical protein